MTNEGRGHTELMMNVHSSTRRRAVLEIYKVHRRPKGGSLSARELERDWKRTGLRRSDLELALREMSLHHLLLMKRAHDGPRYELTYLGERAMQLPLAGGPLAMMHDWLTLRRAKRRALLAASAAGGSRNRRASDPHDPAQDADPQAQDSAQAVRR